LWLQFKHTTQWYTYLCDFIVSEQYTGIYLFILFLLNRIDIRDGEQNIIDGCNWKLSDILQSRFSCLVYYQVSWYSVIEIRKQCIVCEIGGFVLEPSRNVTEKILWPKAVRKLVKVVWNIIITMPCRGLPLGIWTYQELYKCNKHINDYGKKPVLCNTGIYNTPVKESFLT